MTVDAVYEAFLRTAATDAAACVAASDVLALEPRPAAVPDTYDGRLVDVPHLQRAAAGIVHVSADPVLFTLRFPLDYCRSTDLGLQFRVASLRTPLFHPNVRGGMVCLGPYFRPGTRLRPLLEQIFGIVCGRVRATDHAFDAEAAVYYLAHPEQVRDLRSPSLWRRPVAAGRWVEVLT